MQITVRLNHFSPRAQPQVEGIAEDDFGTYFLDVARQHALDRAVRTHRHEGRRLHRSAREGQAPAPRPTIGSEQFEGHMAGTTHWVSSGPRGAGLRVMNMASP